MYYDFYGLKSSPFNITCDPEFFFESSAQKKAFAALQYGIQERKGIILITGEVGTGKTTLCKVLLNRLPSSVKTSLILNPYFSNVQLLAAIVEDFGLTLVKKNRLDIIKQLNAFLLRISEEKGNAVLIIDEAQNLTLRQLEQVRLLSNLETTDSKLLQIVLVGQPELVEKINRPALRQIRQRIFVKYHILPLNEKEVKEYILFRLRKAGISDITILPESFKIIANFSRGIPRMINMLCDRMMLCGFVKERKTFDRDMLALCVEELQ